MPNIRRMMMAASGAGGEPLQWDVTSLASIPDSKSISAEEGNSSSVFVKEDDGTKFYLLGRGNNAVYQYTMSTPWDISTGSYASKSFSLAASFAGTNNPTSLYVRPDGLKAYVGEYGSSSAADDGVIYQYTMSSTWDVSTMSYDSASINITTAQADGEIFRCFDIQPDGKRLILNMYPKSEDVNFQSWVMSTPWNITTATLESSTSVSGFTGLIEEIHVRPDGLQVTFSSSATDTVDGLTMGAL